MLKDLLDKGRTWLGRRQQAKTIAAPTDAVIHDTYDARMFAQLLDEVPALAKMVDDLNFKYPHTRDMVRDVMMEFWQGDPRMRPATDLDPRYIRNHAVATNIAESPETEQTRAFTRHDKYGSAIATLGVADKIKDFLGKQDELEEEQRKQDEAEREEDDAAELLEQALELLEQELGDFDGNGPLTQEQAAAQDNVNQQLQAAEAAAQAVRSANGSLLQAAEQSQQKMASAVNSAVKQAGDQLAEEAAMFAAWGVSDGELQRMSFAERRKLAELLSGNRLSKFVKLLGRFRTSAAAQRAKKVEYGRDEVVGVEFSGDPERFLPQELALSRSRVTRLDFLQRFAEGQILSRKFQGVEKVGQGSIIFLCDCSGSMEYTDKAGITREAFAKAIMFAMLDQARASGRDFVGILFSSWGQVARFDFPRGEGPIERVVEMVETFYRGGTEYSKPIEMALDILVNEFERSGKRKADLVLATDDECSVQPSWMADYLAVKERTGFRMFGIRIGVKRADSTLDALSDNVRAVDDFIDPGAVADIFRTV